MIEFSEFVCDEVVLYEGDAHVVVHETIGERHTHLTSVANDRGIVGEGLESGAVYRHAGATINVSNGSASGASNFTDLAIYIEPGRGTAEDYRSFYLPT